MSARGGAGDPPPGHFTRAWETRSDAKRYLLATIPKFMKLRILKKGDVSVLAGIHWIIRADKVVNHLL